MANNKTIHVKGADIAIFSGGQPDYISITDIARYKDAANTDSIIQNWLRNRNTIELLGFWELMYNPNFKPYGQKVVQNYTYNKHNKHNKHNTHKNHNKHNTYKKHNTYNKHNKH